MRRYTRTSYSAGYVSFMRGPTGTGTSVRNTEGVLNS